MNFQKGDIIYYENFGIGEIIKVLDEYILVAFKTSRKRLDINDRKIILKNNTKGTKAFPKSFFEHSEEKIPLCKLEMKLKSELKDYISLNEITKKFSIPVGRLQKKAVSLKIELISLKGKSYVHIKNIADLI